MKKLTLVTLVLLPTLTFAGTICSPEKMKLIKEQKVGNVFVDCEFTLNKQDIIKKMLILEGEQASNLKIDCAGAKILGGKESIQIKSQKLTSTQGIVSWKRPQNIELKNCIVSKPIRIFGMARNGEGEDLRDSSHIDTKHTRRAQRNAPTNISIENFTFEDSTIYISPGVTRFTLKNSIFSGDVSGVTIYLDAESAHNQILNNIFQNNNSAKREVIAVDGSAYNRIIGNEFRNMNLGGIFLYRNSGEGGTVRHQTPHDNEIINNSFKIDLKNPILRAAIYVNSRNGTKEGRYNEDDAGYPFGSSINNNSLARNNIVAANQIIGAKPDSMILLDYKPNYLFKNIQVSKHVDIEEGCIIKEGKQIKGYVENGKKEFIHDATYSCLNKQVTIEIAQLCRVELNAYNRLVIRNSANKGLAYFSKQETLQAQEELRRLINEGICKAQYGACYVNKNANNRWAVRTEEGKGLFYYGKETEATQKQIELQQNGDCR